MLKIFRKFLKGNPLRDLLRPRRFYEAEHKQHKPIL